MLQHWLQIGDVVFRNNDVVDPLFDQMEKSMRRSVSEKLALYERVSNFAIDVKPRKCICGATHATNARVFAIVKVSR